MKRLVAATFLVCLSLACATTPAPTPARVPVAQVFPAAATESAHVPELIDVRVLLVTYQGADGASSVVRTQADALGRAQMLRSMAKGGERLSLLVRDYSDRANAHEDLGVVRLHSAGDQRVAPVLLTAAIALPVGDISDVLTTPQGYVVLERLKDPPQGPEEIAAKHILVSYSTAPKAIPGVSRSESEARSVAERVAEQAQAAGAEWDALAAQFTDEPGSKTRGGDLGRFGRGRMVPAFERAAFGLKVGDVSGVVQTPFGFHVIRRYE